jgi:hypothetical protein
MTLRLSMTCGPYDRARALIDGAVRPEGIELAITVNDDDVERRSLSPHPSTIRPTANRSKGRLFKPAGAGKRSLRNSQNIFRI